MALNANCCNTCGREDLSRSAMSIRRGLDAWCRLGVKPVGAMLALLLAGSGSAVHAAAYADTQIADPEVRACIEATLPQHTLSQKLAVVVTEGSGPPRESRGTLEWKRGDDGLSKVLVHIDASIQFAGVAILMIERKKGDPEVYMYSPEMGRERRIASSALAGPLLGTDFSYEDFAFMQHVLATGQVKRQADGEVEGHPAYVLETLPAEDGSAYSRISTRIEKESCVPMITEFFGPNGTQIKQLAVARAAIKKIGQRNVPGQMTMNNPKAGSRTVLTVTDAVFDLTLDDSRFTPVGIRRMR